MLFRIVYIHWLQWILTCLSLTLCIQKVNTTTCKRQVTRQTITYKDCLPKRILTRACVGSCVTSASVSSTNPLQITRSCFQCKESIIRQKKVRLTCPNPEGPQPFRRILIEVPVPMECMCESCSFHDVIEVIRSNSEQSK
ncbi:hypothetical protein ACF0H5_006102 [Mactra antiquata]